MSRRVLLPDDEIRRVVTIAQEMGIAVAGLDVGTDYVRLLPPSQGGDSVAKYIGATHRPKKVGER